MMLPSGYRVPLEDGRRQAARAISCGLTVHAGDNGDGTINVLIGPPLSCLGYMDADGHLHPVAAFSWYGARPAT